MFPVNEDLMRATRRFDAAGRPMTQDIENALRAKEVKRLDQRTNDQPVIWSWRSVTHRVLGAFRLGRTAR